LALQWILLGAVAAVLLWAEIAVSAAQELPPGGSIPPLRRGANGQVEIVPPDAAVGSRLGRRGAATGATAPNRASTGVGPKEVGSVARGSGPPPPKPVTSVTLAIPKVADTSAREEAILTTYSVKMSDESPITVPGALGTLATAINNSGQIVGSVSYGKHPQHPGFLKKN